MRHLLRTLLLSPALLVCCGSVFQGPLWGSIELEQPTDAGDAVAFLRCRGAGIHGEINTDAEDTRVRPNGRFGFVGSLTFPTTERCYIQIRHPRYLTTRVELSDKLVQKLEPIAPQSWEAYFAAGKPYDINPGSHRPWPESEIRRHLVDTLTWLRALPAAEQQQMARYVPDIHAIYTRAVSLGPGARRGWRDILKMISRFEQATAYPYPFTAYTQAVLAGDAEKVQVFIDGGVLRQSLHDRQRSMLYLAAHKGHLEVIAVLLANDEPLNIPGCGAPVLGALSAGKWQAALALLRAGADIDPGCEANHRRVGDALRSFVRGGQLDLLGDFLDAGVPVDIPDSGGNTALVTASTGGHIQAVKLLLAAGADPDQRTADQLTLAEDARQRGFLDVERELLREGRALQPEPAGNGVPIALPWRRGETQPYRVHTSFGEVHRMLADPHEAGVLWLGTGGGLVRVNPSTGERRTWTRADGLPAGRVRELWFDADGGYLWLGTSGGLARLALDPSGRIERVGDIALNSGYASGFLQAGTGQPLWFWNNKGLYRIDPENSEALHHALQPGPFGAAVAPDGPEFFVSDNATLWRLDSRTGERAKVLDASALDALVSNGPHGPPQLRSLTVDARGGYLWIGTFRHGVFRLVISSGELSRLQMSSDQIKRCARTTVTPHLHGQVMRAAGKTFTQLERCFGRIQDNSFTGERERIDAGPVADSNGDLWFIAGNRFHRLDQRGKEQQFARAPDPLGNAQVTAIELQGDHLLVSAYRSTLAMLDLKRGTWSSGGSAGKGKGKSTPRRRQQSVDPDIAEFIWGIQGRGVYLNKGSRRIHSWPASLPAGSVKVSRNTGTTVWIGSGEGLIEFPIPESLAELRALAEPQRAPQQVGRGPR